MDRGTADAARTPERQPGGRFIGRPESGFGRASTGSTQCASGGSVDLNDPAVTILPDARLATCRHTPTF